jgi:hypothetical protein
MHKQWCGALRPGSVLRAGVRSLCKGGTRPHQGRAHAGKEPEAGQLRPVPAGAACGEAGARLTICRRRADMAARAGDAAGVGASSPASAVGLGDPRGLPEGTWTAARPGTGWPYQSVRDQRDCEAGAPSVVGAGAVEKMTRLPKLPLSGLGKAYELHHGSSVGQAPGSSASCAWPMASRRRGSSFLQFTMTFCAWTASTASSGTTKSPAFST